MFSNSFSSSSTPSVVSLWSSGFELSGSGSACAPAAAPFGGAAVDGAQAGPGLRDTPEKTRFWLSTTCFDLIETE